MYTPPSKVLSMDATRARLLRLRWASGLLIAQGALMELSVFVGVVALATLGVPQTSVADRVGVFALPYLNEHLSPLVWQREITPRAIGPILRPFRGATRRRPRIRHAVWSPRNLGVSCVPPRASYTICSIGERRVL